MDPASTQSGGSKNDEFLKRKVRELKDLTGLMKDDLSGMENYFNSSFEPYYKELHRKLIQLYNDCSDTDREVATLDFLGNFYSLSGAISLAVGVGLFFVSGPLAPVTATLGGGACGLVGLGTKHKASRLRSSFDQSTLRVIDQTWASYTGHLKTLEQKYSNMFSRYRGILAILEELRDICGLGSYKPEILGESTFNNLKGSLEDFQNFDFKSKFQKTFKEQGTDPKKSFMLKVVFVIEKITAFFLAVLKKIGSAISSIAGKMGINIGDDANFILQEIWKGANLVKDFSKAFSNTMIINPFLCLLGAGYEGVTSFLNLKKNITEENESACAKAAESLIEQIENDHTVLADLISELRPIRGQYDNLAEDLEFLSDLIG